MRGSCWNPTEPMALASGQSQQSLDQQQQQPQQQIAKEEPQQPPLAAATPAWGLADGVENNNTTENTARTVPSSPTETSTVHQTNYGNYNFAKSQAALPPPPNYPTSYKEQIKAEPQEHPEYDSGRETLNDPEEDDTVELTPEILEQTEVPAESNSKESSNAVKQAPKRQTARKAVKCPICNFESDNMNREHLLNHLKGHCAMANQAPSSSAPSEDAPGEDDPENESIVDDDLNLRMPQITAQGNVKFYRCKKCKAPSLTKYDSWIHQREHMTPEKILYCKVCPFATEYKHHLEYHMRNHYGSKPFKCPKCNYTCVNKSMLNSHLKSHSSVYQYRCASCSYVTKYCHSLKVHLKRNMHEPAVVLNPDGTPNPNPIIDVNSSRRGPRSKPPGVPGAKTLSPPESPNFEDQLCPVPLYPEISYTQFPGDHSPPRSFYLNGKPQENLLRQLYLNSQVENSSFWNRDILETAYAQNQQALVQNGFLLQAPNQVTAIHKNLAVIGYMKMIQDLSARNQKTSETESDEQEAEAEAEAEQEPEAEPEAEPEPEAEAPLESSTSSTSEPLDLSYKSDSNSVSSNSPAKKRKRATLAPPEPEESEIHEEIVKTEVEVPKVEIESKPEEAGENDGRILVYKNGIKQNMYICRICDIMFRNEVMFSIHMGYHGRSDPLSCNICGEKCVDHVSFFVHVTNSKH